MTKRINLVSFLLTLVCLMASCFNYYVPINLIDALIYSDELDLSIISTVFEFGTHFSALFAKR